MPRLSSNVALASGEGRLGDTGCWRVRSPEAAFLKDMSFRSEAPGLTTTYVTSRSVGPIDARCPGVCFLSGRVWGSNFLFGALCAVYGAMQMNNGDVCVHMCACGYAWCAQ